MRVLAVSSSGKSLSGLISLIKEAGFEAYPCLSGSDARRKILDEEWDEVVINYPLSDESGAELANMIEEESGAVCIILARSENISMIGSNAITVEKPIIKPLFFQALRLGLSIRERLAVSEKRIRKLESRIEEMRIESKAKCMLSLKKGMSEEEGHRYIEKMAMDNRITLREAAYSIVLEE